jgi:hypothetical protein
MQQNVALARAVLNGVSAWPDPSKSPAANALQHALITDPTRISPQTREKLHLLVGHHLPVTNE